MEELLGISFLIIMIIGVAIPYVLIERGLKKEFGWKIGFWDHLPYGRRRSISGLFFQLGRVLEYHRLKKVRTGRMDIKILLIFISWPLGMFLFIAWIVLSQLE